MLVSSADASVATLDAQTGDPIPSANGQSSSAWLRPKNPDSALALFALDAMACPVSLASAHLPLAWAAAGVWPPLQRVMLQDHISPVLRAG